MKRTKQWWWPCLGGLVGIINGLLGAGGGLIAVPMLRTGGLSQKEAHAGSVFLIFCLSILSGGISLFRGQVQLGDILPYLPGGILGSILGAFLLRKISNFWLAIFTETSQAAAGGMNLLFFLPTAAVALFFHWKAGMLHLRLLWKPVLFGLAGALAGSLLSGVVPDEWLRKIFGGLLLVLGGKELIFGWKKDKQA